MNDKRVTFLPIIALQGFRNTLTSDALKIEPNTVVMNY